MSPLTIRLIARALLSLGFIWLFSGTQDAVSSWLERQRSSGSEVERLMLLSRGRWFSPGDASKRATSVDRFSHLVESIATHGRRENAPSADDSLNIRAIGRWPYGPSFTAALDTEREVAFLGSGGVVYVLDIQDPLSPLEIGKILTPGVASGLCLREGILYVADGGEGLRVISVADLSNPVELGHYHTPMYAFDLAVEDSLAYVICMEKYYDTMLQVISISDPSKMREVASYEPSGLFPFLMECAVRDTIAFLAGDMPGLRVLSVVDPTKPEEIGAYGSSLFSRDVEVSDTLAFLSSHDDGLLILSVADPQNPYEVGSSVGPEVFDLELALSDSFAYLGGWEEFRVVSITNPAAPVETGSLNSSFFSVDVDHGLSHAFLTDSWNGLWTITVEDPAHPAASLSFSTNSWVEDIAVSDTLLCFTEGTYGVRILSVSNPSDPISIGSYQLPQWTTGIDVKAPYAYVTSDTGFTILSIVNPRDPIPVGFLDHSDRYVKVSGDYAFLYGWGAGFDIVRIQDPANPSLVSMYSTQGRTEDMAVSGSYAYLANGDKGLEVVDISDPNFPNGVGAYDSPGYARGIDVVGDEVFLADSEGGLFTILVEDPSNPILLNHCAEVGYDAMHVQVSGGLAFLACGEYGGLRVMNPGTCEEFGYHDTPGEATRIDLAGSYAYMVDTEGGVSILEYFGPSSIGGEEDAFKMPTVFSLSQNYPNPFNPQTTITYSIPGTAGAALPVRLAVYDLRGRLVRQLVDGMQQAGTHSLSWDGRDGNGLASPSGIYFMRLDAAGNVVVRKMIMAQ